MRIANYFTICIISHFVQFVKLFSIFWGQFNYVTTQKAESSNGELRPMYKAPSMTGPCDVWSDSIT